MLAEFLAVLAERRLTPALDAEGKVLLLGLHREVTPALADALEALGPALAEHLGGKPAAAGPAADEATRKILAEQEDWLAAKGEPAFGPPRKVELKWGNGYVGEHFFPEKGWPVGARFWRHAGDADWQPVPRRTST